jgi:hypothetical protein
MKTYNIVDVHPYKPYLIVDDDFADYLREESFDIDDFITTDSFMEFWELLDQYMQEES